MMNIKNIFLINSNMMPKNSIFGVIDMYLRAISYLRLVLFFA
ncbi:hypothetical protein Xmir_02913 [Xenorhabdus miraniensis]|uniref:Uncharacterized protein n=1 Tax=Xenorhabdus miraniensis TaxID=351674 RepID=A0A2D0JNC2_9GAMM|nr:hypothetical protein Xmir_02913 [Xenorhabdus miraniensis]